MKKTNSQNKRTRADVHRAFERRVKKVFHFLVDEFAFTIAPRPRDLDISREIYISYLKDQDVYILFHGEGIFQHALLGSRSRGTSPRGLQRLMKLRCPDETIPRTLKTEIESELQNQLEFVARILQQYFLDFLEGDSRVLDLVT